MTRRSPSLVRSLPPPGHFGVAPLPGVHPRRDAQHARAARGVSAAQQHTPRSDVPEGRARVLGERGTFNKQKELAARPPCMTILTPIDCAAWSGVLCVLFLFIAW